MQLLLSLQQPSAVNISAAFYAACPYESKCVMTHAPAAAAAAANAVRAPPGVFGLVLVSIVVAAAVAACVAKKC